jgi:hypothetical protein
VKHGRATLPVSGGTCYFPKPMRTIALLAVLGLSSACGSVCDGAIGAERSANQKALNCSLQNITVHDTMRCNSGLSKCNSDDLNEISNYASCLNALPVCSSSNEIQFAGQRQGCINQAAARISFTCFANVL